MYNNKLRMILPIDLYTCAKQAAEAELQHACRSCSIAAVVGTPYHEGQCIV